MENKNILKAVKKINNFDNENINIAFLFQAGKSGSIFIQSLLDSHDQILQIPFIVQFYFIHKALINFIKKNNTVISKEIIIEVISNNLNYLSKSPFFHGLGEEKNLFIEFDNQSFINYLSYILDYFSLDNLNSKNILLIINFSYALSKKIDLDKIKLIFCHHHFFSEGFFSLSDYCNNLEAYEKEHKNKFENKTREVIKNLLTDFPYAKIIVSKRHPFEAYYSYFKSVNNKNKIDLLGYKIKLSGIIVGYYNLQFLEKNYPKNLKIVKLEDLHKNGRNEINNLANFLGIEIRDSLYKSTIENKKMWVLSIHQERNNLESTFDKNFKNKWATGLNNDEKNIVFNLFDNKVSYYNYDNLDEDFFKQKTSSINTIKEIKSLIFQSFYFLELYPKQFMNKKYITIHEVYTFITKCLKNLLKNDDNYYFDNSFVYFNKKLKIQYKIFEMDQDKNDDSYFLLFIGNNNIPKIDDINLINKKVDKLFVPSNVLKDKLESLGIIKNKIDILPFPIDDEIYDINKNKKNPMLDNIEGFKFLYIDNYYDIEMIELLLVAFIEEFGNEKDVYLVFKYSEELTVKENVDIILKYTHLGNKNIILIIDNFYDTENTVSFDSGFAQLYNSCNFLIYPYSEYYSGINIIKALYFDLPVIVPDKLSSTDFCNKNNSILIKSNFNENNKLEIKKDDLKNSMRDAYNNYKKLKDSTLLESKKIRETHNIDSFIDIFNQKIEQVFKYPIINSNYDDFIKIKLAEAIKLYENKEYFSSISIYEEIFEYEKNYIFIYNIGLCYLEIGNYEQALDYFLDYLENTAITKELSLKISICLEKLGFLEEAELYKQNNF